MACYGWIIAIVWSISISSTHGKSYSLKRLSVTAAEWCGWSDWSECGIEYIDDYQISIKTRTRTCACPPPRDGGMHCKKGLEVEEQDCEMGQQHEDVDYSYDDVQIAADEGSGNIHLPGADNDENDDHLTFLLAMMKEEDESESNEEEEEEDNEENENHLMNPVSTEKSIAPTDDESVNNGCTGFRELLKTDDAKADRCCEVMRNWNSVENNDLLSDAVYPHHLDQDVDDLSASDAKLPLPGLTARPSISELEECLSLNLDVKADLITETMMQRQHPRYTCRVSGNRKILHTICCVYDRCSSWTRVGLRGICSACHAEKLCTCRGVFLSG